MEKTVCSTCDQPVNRRLDGSLFCPKCQRSVDDDSTRSVPAGADGCGDPGGCDRPDDPRRLKPRIYIAGPISIGNQFHNAANGIRAASAVFHLGAIPYCPHLTALWDFVDPSMRHEDWMEICFAWIPQCDAVLRIPGESHGADRECEYARSLGIPVVDSMAAVEALTNRSRGQA